MNLVFATRISPAAALTSELEESAGQQHKSGDLQDNRLEVPNISRDSLVQGALFQTTIAWIPLRSSSLLQNYSKNESLARTNVDKRCTKWMDGCKNQT